MSSMTIQDPYSLLFIARRHYLLAVNVPSTWKDRRVPPLPILNLCRTPVAWFGGALRVAL